MNTPIQRNLVCASGGLDSTVALYESMSQDCDTYGFSVDYGQQHSMEIQFAKAHFRRLQIDFSVITIPKLGGLTEESKWIVPNRNDILIQLAAAKAVEIGATRIIVGFNADDEAGFPDCRQAFIQHCNTGFQIKQIAVEVVAPFLRWPKWKIAALARDHKIPPHEIWTCYQPKDGKQCGLCPACIKLEKALNHK